MAAKDASFLAGRVKELRDAAAISQMALAVKAGLSLAVVAQIEQGKKVDPRMSTITALAEALGVSVDALAKPDAKQSGTRTSKPRKAPAAASRGKRS